MNILADRHARHPACLQHCPGADMDPSRPSVAPAGGTAIQQLQQLLPVWVALRTQEVLIGTTSRHQFQLLVEGHHPPVHTPNKHLCKPHPGQQESPSPSQAWHITRRGCSLCNNGSQAHNTHLPEQTRAQGGGLGWQQAAGGPWNLLKQGVSGGAGPHNTAT